MTNNFFFSLEYYLKHEELELSCEQSLSFPVSDFKVTKNNISVNIFSLLATDTELAIKISGFDNKKCLLQSINNEYYKLWQRAWIKHHPYFDASAESLFSKFILNKHSDFDITLLQLLWKSLSKSIVGLKLLFNMFLPKLAIGIGPLKCSWVLLHNNSNRLPYKMDGSSVLGYRVLAAKRRVSIQVTISDSMAMLHSKRLQQLILFWKQEGGHDLLEIILKIQLRDDLRCAILNKTYLGWSARLLQKSVSNTNKYQHCRCIRIK